MVRGYAAATADNCLAHENHVSPLGIFGDLVGQVIFICIRACAFYRLLRDVSRPWGWLIVAFVLIFLRRLFFECVERIGALSPDFLFVIDKLFSATRCVIPLQYTHVIAKMFWGLSGCSPRLAFRSAFCRAAIGVLANDQLFRLRNIERDAFVAPDLRGCV